METPSPEPEPGVDSFTERMQYIGGFLLTKVSQGELERQKAYEISGMIGMYLCGRVPDADLSPEALEVLNRLEIK